MEGADRMKTKKQRFISAFMAFVFIVNLIDGRAFMYCWEHLRAFAAVQDYTGYFQWNISELTKPPTDGSAVETDDSTIVMDKNGKEIREVTMTNNVDLLLKEFADDNPVLKTTFYFNLKNGVDPGLLEFTITGMDELIRDGKLQLNDKDPNLVKTWEIIPNDNGSYTFRNKVRVTSNNETTFTWQFNSRDAINDTNITLQTECKITEIKYDTETGEATGREVITLDTNDLTFSYQSEPDKCQVKIVCEALEDLDVNNLNVKYDWRSYRSVLGLEGLYEYKNKNGSIPLGKNRSDFESEQDYNNYINDIAQYIGYVSDENGTASQKFLDEYANQEGVIDWDAVQLYNAHAVSQVNAEQEKNKMARGIKRADYFIEVTKPDSVKLSDIMVVNSNGDRVQIVEKEINGRTVYGFYDFQGAGDRKPGESYSCVYRVGVLNDTVRKSENPIEIQLKGHYLVTYQDTTSPVDYTDTAAHKLSIEDEQPVGTGDYINKYNNYEINNGYTYNNIAYESHSKHYSPVNQLLYDSVFNGRVVTYALTASTRQARYADDSTKDADGNARKYDLVYEDNAPSIQNLDGADDRELRFDEYDFTRIRLSKLVDGNTVGEIDETVTDETVYKEESGFPFVIYGKSNDDKNTEYYNTWKEIGTGTTLEESEILLPSGIDEIRIVVRDLKIRAYLRAYVDIQYNLDYDELYDKMKIDTTSEFEIDGNRKVCRENTNKGTRLVNEFTRKQYLDTNYDANNYNENNFQNISSAHSNTWLRESTTTIDSKTTMEDFVFHDTFEEMKEEMGGQVESLDGFTPSDYYSTVISSSGTIQSDSESALNHFAVYSKLPDGLTPSEDWLEKFRESLVFSGVLQGSNEAVDADFMLNNGAVNVYYDSSTGCIVADFDCRGFSLRADSPVSVDFSYPAEISLAKVKASGASQTTFTAETYMTVLDKNVKLSPAENKTLTEADETPYQKAKSAKSSDYSVISAMGSQKSNYSTKYVASFYNGWVYDNDAEVDGSNTHHLEGKKMTSEYTYALAFHRITTEREIVEDPMILDIVEGLRSSAWQGRVNKIHFDEKSYPAGYEPVVYYMLNSSSAVSVAESGDYSSTNATIMETISNFQKYENTTDVSSLSARYQLDLEFYNTLKEKIKTNQDGWTKATENNDGSWTINKSNVYAVAVIFEGSCTVTDNYLELGAYMDMTAPPLENSQDVSKIINNRATYNESHVFAEGIDNTGTHFPMYSVGNRTLVILRHHVELEKVDSKDGHRLSGAKFTIFSNTSNFENTASNPNIVSYYTFDKKRNRNQSHQMLNMAVDISGILKLNLSPGIYYYKETSPPTGYNPDERIYRFRVTADTDAVYYYFPQIYNTLENLNDEYIIVNHSEYIAYTDIYSGKTPFDNSFPLYVFDSDGKTINKFRVDTDNAGKYIYDETDGDTSEINAVGGLITLNDLPAGTYLLAKSFGDTDGYQFSVADDSEISFNVIKKSTLSTGLVYNLYEKSGSGITANDRLCYFSKTADGVYSLLSAPPAENATEKMKITPAADGKISLNGLDSQKEYYLVVSDAPQGYKFSQNKSVYDITESGSAEFYAAENLIKQNRIVVEDDPIEVADAKFRKIDDTLNSENYGNSINGAVYNMYLVESDGSESLMYFQYNSLNKKYVYMGTTGMTGYTNNLVSGTSQSQDTSEDDTGDGMIEISGLPYGTYFIQESSAPLGYQLNSKKQYFRVSAATIDKDGNLIFASDDDEQDTETTDSEGSQETDGSSSDSSDSNDLVMKLKDYEILSKIVINKTEEINKDNYLKNASYDLYRLVKGMDIEEARAASINSKGNTSSEDFTKYWEYITTSYTDVTGEADFKNLPFGTYLLYEKQPPVGYRWNNDIGKWETWTLKDAQHTKNNQVIILSEQTVSENSSVTYETVTDADGNSENVPVVTYHEFFAGHLDERKDGSARLIKKNEENLGLYDGVFALYKVNLTDEEKAKVLGKTMEELSQMSPSDIQKEISKKELSVSDMDIENHFDLENGTPKNKPDVEQTIDTAVDQNMKTNADITTRGATKTISGLEWGLYYFYEIKAPAGYKADSTPHVFAVNSRSVDTLIEVNATDAKIYGEVWLYKQAKDKIENTNDHLKLFGAQFRLYTDEGKLVKSVPKLRLGGLDTSVSGVSSSGRKEFLVKSFEVKSFTQIEFKIFDDDGTEYTVTVDYESTKDGKITGITINDTAFTTKYGNNFNGTYQDDNQTKYYRDDLRLAYYVVAGDGSQYYDGRKYVGFAEEPILPEQSQFTDSDGNYDDAAYSEAMEDYYLALADYVLSERIKSCVTDTYVTADEGGRLNVRGLDWTSYYFRETVPPDGYALADDVIFTVNAYNCDNQFLSCEDPVAQAAVIIDKKIPDASYFNAYGEPTFMFKVYGLEEISGTDETPDYTTNNVNYKKNGKEYTLSIHLTSPNTTGSAMVNVPVGQYLIEEIPVSRYVCTGLELVDGTRNNPNDKFKSVGLTTPTSYLIYNNDSKYDINISGQNQWKAFCDLTGGDNEFAEIPAFHIRYTNEIERYDNFSHVSYADNRIPEREYITAFKPIYSSLIPVYSGTQDTYTYEIDLGQALTDGVFEGVLTYNTGKTVELTDLSKIQFRTSGNSPVTNVQWDSSSKILRVTVSDPSASAGSAISLDVGYSDYTPFTEYNTANTNMVRGTLNLTFSEIQADRVKKLTLKNDVNNKSYFPYADENNHVQDITSVAVLYRQSADDNSFEKEMQNEEYTDTLNVSSEYQLKYWYLLDNDGRPVLDKENHVIQFQRDSNPENDEIVQYMFNGTWPAYLAENDEHGNLLPDTFADPDNVENVNSFTFQAEVEESKLPKAKLMEGPTVHDYLDNIANSSGNHSRIKEIKISDTPPWENGHTNYILPTQSNLNSTQYMAISVTYPLAVSADGTFTEYGNYDADFPNVIYAWCEWNNGSSTYAIRWYTDDPVGIMANENSSNLFKEMNSLYDVDVTTIMNTSLVTDAKYMFYMKNNATALKSLDLTNWDLSNVTDMSYMFYDLKGLKSISFDSSFEKCTTTEQMFAQSTVLCDISFSDKTNFSSLENVNMMFDNTARLGYNTDSNGNPTTYNKTKLIDILTSMKLGKTKLFQSGLPDNNRRLIWTNTSGGNITNRADSLVVFPGGDGNMYEIGGNSGTNDERCRLRLHS